MPRGPRKLQVSFAGGEMSPKMYSRQDDARFRSGLARARNFTTAPQGSASRRPGFGLVRETKDSTYRSRLLEFEYSVDDTYAVEMGKADVDGREIGYFRFHTEGGTLLQPLPDDYKQANAVTALVTATDRLTVTAHGLETGDPIVFTLLPDPAGLTATFNAGTEIVTTGAAHGFGDGDNVLFLLGGGGALPPELETNKVYYVRDTGSLAANEFRVAEFPGGPLIDFSGAGSPTVVVACMPRPAESFYMVNRTLYAIVVDANTIQVALSQADALAASPVAVNFAGSGTIGASGEIRVHYDYRNGAVALFPNIGLIDEPYYMFRETTWGTPLSRYVYVDDHTDHDPTVLEYWMRQSGSSTTVTFTPGPPGIVTWATHGLADGDVITFTNVGGALPLEIVAGTVYYVRNTTLNTFELSTTRPGPVIPSFSSAGTGTHTAFANGIYEVPHFYEEDAQFEVTTSQSGDVLSIAHFDRPLTELRRRGVTDWILLEVRYNAQVDVPTEVDVSIVPGEGDGDIINAVTVGTVYYVRFSQLPTMLIGEWVRCENVESASGVNVYIPDGDYVVSEIDTANKGVAVKEIESGAPVVGAAFTDISTVARMRVSTPWIDRDETYAVTALDANGEESPASEIVTVTNNLAVAGSYNRITWAAVTGAARYRVYKEVNGLLGYVGEVDAPATTFDDDNIDPDLSITPPILDAALFSRFTPAFNVSEDFVQQGSHGLQTGQPIIFQSNAAQGPGTGLPSGIEFNKTYYVINPGDDEFQLTTTPTGSTVLNLGAAGDGEPLALVGDWPSAVGYFEQRRVFAGSRLRPQDFWLTASSTETDLTYSLPTRDADRIQNRLAARKRSAIRHVAPVGNLIFLTSAAEFRLTPLNSESLTPTSVSARAPTHIGARQVEPAIVNNVVVFAANRGGHIREMGYADPVGDYITGDLSLRAAHLFDDYTITQLTYQQAPQPTIWAVSSRGTLVAVTYVPEEQIVGWHEHDTNGLFESCIAVREGEEDRIYAIVNRGGTRYVERMGSQYTIDIEDVFYVDFGVTYDDAVTATSTIFVPELASESVIFLADGIEGSGTVSAGGVLTLTDSEGNTISANTVHAGLAYTGELLTIPLGMQIDQAFGSGRHWNINKIWVRVYESGSFSVGPDLASMSDSEAPTAGTLDTAHIEVLVDGEWKLDGQIYITQSGALPLTVTGLTYEVEPGA